MEEQLANLRQALRELPWATVRAIMESEPWVNLSPLMQWAVIEVFIAAENRAYFSKQGA